MKSQYILALYKNYNGEIIIIIFTNNNTSNTTIYLDWEIFTESQFHQTDPNDIILDKKRSIAH